MRLNGILRFVADQDVVKVTDKLLELKKAFAEFEDAHLLYVDENVEDEYFQEVQDKYIKTLSEVNVYLKSQNKPISEAGCLPPSSVRLPPAPQPQVFDGNPENYPIWKAAFSTLIDRKDIPI